MYKERYFLKADHQREWDEVSQEEFVRAERNAGFFPKTGCGPVATGGFGGHGMQGKVESEIVVSDISTQVTCDTRDNNDT